MATGSQQSDIVDLLSDSDDDVAILPEAPINSHRQDLHMHNSTESQHTQHSSPRRSLGQARGEDLLPYEPPPPYAEGRVHHFHAGGIDKSHYIPNDQFSCRGCSIEPLEEAYFGKAASSRNQFRPRPNVESSTAAGTNATVDAAADAPTRTTAADERCADPILIDGDSPVTSMERGLDEEDTLRPGFNHVLDVVHEPGTASNTEQGSDSEYDIQQIARPSMKNKPLAMLQTSRKGKERERLVNLSNPSDDDYTTSSSRHFDSAITLPDGDEQSDDEEFRRAVALSLQEQRAFNPPASNSNASSTPSRSHRAIEISDDEEEEEFIRAVALSLQEVPSSQSAESPKRTTAIVVQNQVESNETTLSPSPILPSSSDAPADRTAQAETTAAPASGAADPTTPTLANTAPAFSLAGLDRKQMEQERNARQKRKHEGDNDDGRRPKAARITQTGTATATQSRTTNISPPPLQRQSRPSTTATSGLPLRNPGGGSNTLDSKSAAATSPWGTTPNRYPKGKVFQTFVAGYPADNTIDFPTLIADKASLESCLLSSFIWDFDWLFPHFDLKHTKFQLVMHAKGAAQREALRADFKGVPNVRLCFPPMDGMVNCMHSKLMLLFYKDEDAGGGTGNRQGQGKRQRLRCRIVIPTANLMGFDWGVGAFMENTLWLIDLPPRLSAGAQDETRFEKSLKTFLRAQTVPDDVVQKLERFDFRETVGLGFVHTIGGMHVGDTTKSTGVCGLGQTVTALGLATDSPNELDYVASSLGNLSDGFMSSLYLAAQGDNGFAEYDSRLGTGTGTGTADRGAKGVKVGQDWKTNFRFYFPSDATVRRSKGGPRNAGTICFSSKWWTNGTFPTSNMRDCVSVREGLLMHNKLLYVRPANLSDGVQLPTSGWTYVGSANLSESAWGRLVQDKITKQPKLNCRNWECGVLIPSPAEADSRQNIPGIHVSGVMRLAGFQDVVPVPMRFPGESLVAKKPWTFFR
ncbi:tyrosyl-DNA phosphodiesterase-domain-containing protein [Exophiala viscosa]|uniref:Tyrosyl-DNA phosphodiesterase-domain-containing protein n=1 Tax=Exophiala viscosa TaxID=2486360 RepID=A0AAN6DQX1_9EURO|nr:tyrosyl-DNA phosphodiesterase-domain-containing protein [Exophiala viscosa]